LKRNTPVVIFAFKKFVNLKMIFELVNDYNPPKVYIVIDQSKDVKTQQIQARIEKLIAFFQFSTSVDIIRPKSPQGIKQIFDFGLNRIFQEEEELIILEDDTIPSPLFFDYCDTMLKRFALDDSIGCINGCNLETSMQKDAYFLSAIGLPFWGWATWKNRWQKITRDYAFWETFRINEPVYKNEFLEEFSAIFDRFVKKDKSWDIRWTMFLLANKMKTVLPGANLVTNVGFTHEATFTNIPNSSFSNLNMIQDTKESLNYELELRMEEAYLSKIKLLINDVARRK
jgi:hypothetical protein